MWPYLVPNMAILTVTYLLRDPGLRRSPRRAPPGEGVTISVDEVQRAFTSSLPILASDAGSAVLSNPNPNPSLNPHPHLSPSPSPSP